MPLDVFALRNGRRTAHVALEAGFLQCFEKPLGNFERTYGVEISEYADFSIRHPAIFSSLLAALEQEPAARDATHHKTLEQLHALLAAAGDDGCIVGEGE